MVRPGFLGLPAHRVRRVALVPWLADALGWGTILLLAVALATPLWTAPDLVTGAGDWHAQAFRVEELRHHGLTSWSHVWAGGMPLWEGYQALPHLVTLGLVQLSGLETTRAMVLLTALALIVLRAGGYGALRLAGAPPVAALAGTLAAAALDTARQPLANYTEFWGLALAPLLLATAYRWAGRPGGLVVAALAGLAVEVHPLLALNAALALAAGWLADRHHRSPVLLVGQGAVLLTGAAVWWTPLATSARPAYTEPYFSSPAFMQLLWRLNTASFAPGWPVLLAAVGAVALIAGRYGPASGPAWFLVLLGGAIGLLITASLTPWGPDVLREAQLPRLASVLPLLAGAATALGVAALARWGNPVRDPDRTGELPVAMRWATGRGWRGPALAWGAAGALAALALLRTGSRPPPVASAAPTPDTLTRALERARPNGRVWLDAAGTGEQSFLGGGQLRFAGSYSGQEWSVVAGPTSFFLEGRGSARNRAAYLAAHGVGLLVVPAGVRPEIVDPRTGEAASWELVDRVSGFDLLRPPWQPLLAWTLPVARRDGLTVPDRDFRDVSSAFIRDEAVARYAAVSLGGEGRSALLRYPSPTTLQVDVDVTARDGARYLVVDENWDRTWRAHAGGRTLAVERFGPNHLGVDLTGVTGEATIRLTHGWPPGAQVGLALSLAALPLGVLTLLVSRWAACRSSTTQ